jgi:hypothetical protein
MPATNLVPAEPTRAPSGLSIDQDVGMMANSVLPDPTREIRYFDEFTHPLTYTLSEVGVAVRALSILEEGGVQEQTTAAVEGNNAVMRVPTSVVSVEDSKVVFSARIKVDVALQSIPVFGLATSVDDPLANATDGVFFVSPDESNVIQLVLRTASVDVVTLDIGTLVDDTYVTVGFSYDGDRKISTFVDRNFAGSSDASQITDALLVPFLMIQTGEAVAHTVSQDWVLVSKVR